MRDEADLGAGTFDPDLPLTMQTLRPDDEDGAAPSLVSGLSLGERLGEGGMGIVLSAEQGSLRRNVAVKRAREPSAALRGRLVREAMVTGALAHPNVVPVYDLRVDEAGEPLLVMQRVEGRPWSAFLAGGPPPSGARDPLAWHARVLEQVCHAVASAHARGVLHRDLKPDNVMIGRYGEVYVLDWGLAVALPGCAIPGLPPAAASRGVAGTPAYLAPEQARGASLSVATDVWLLGALLYEVVHRHPPHRDAPGRSGEPSLPAILALAARGTPPLPPPPTPELGEVLARALAAVPADRYPDVESFRDALAWAVARREARAELSAAAAHLAALTDAVAGQDGQVVAVRAASARDAARRVLSAWPGDREARSAFRAATDAAVGWHLDHGEPGAAETLLADDPEPPADLRARVAAARADADARVARLRHAEDRRTGVRTRGVVLLVAGLTWSGGPLALQALGPPSRAEWAASSLGGLAMGVALAVWARDSLSKSKLNQQVQQVVVLAPLVHLLAQLGGFLADLPMDTTFALSMLGFVGMSAAGVVALGASALPSLLASCVAFPVALVRPQWTIPLYALTNLGFLLTSYLLAWRELRDVVHEDLVELEGRLRC